MKNKKAQSVAFGLIAAIMFFMFGMIVVQILGDDISRTKTELTCSSPTSDGNKVLCLGIDIVSSWLFVMIISTVGGLVVNKLLQ